MRPLLVPAEYTAAVHGSPQMHVHVSFNMALLRLPTVEPCLLRCTLDFL